MTITPSTTVAGAHAVLEVSFSHGCDGSATTEVTIRIPEGINSVAPTRHPSWEVEKEMQQLDPPLTDSHGAEVTERVAAVTYRTDVPVPDGHRDTFELALQLPDAAGETLAFPTLQTCEAGESAWIEVAADAEEVEDLELPAPTVTITAADEGIHGEATSPAADAAGAEGSHDPSDAASEEDGAGPVAWLALAAGVVGAVLGAAALVLQRRRS